MADGAAGERRERLVSVDRGPFARQLDATLRVLCLSEATAYRALGALARELLRRRGHRRLGFVRVGDYARERLGISGRELETMACVAGRLAGLPRTDAAFGAGALTWTQVRQLSAVATAETEETWIALARERSVSALETLVRAALAATPAAAAAGAAAGRGIGAVVDDDEDHDDPVVQVRLACPGRVRALFRRAVDLARAMSGAPVPLSEAVEAMAAEGLSGRNPAADGPEATTVGPQHAGGRSDGADSGTADSGASEDDPRSARRGPRPCVGADADTTRPSPSEPVPRPLLEALGAARDALATLRDLAAPAGDRDAFDLDARLRRGMQVVATTAPRLGALLRILIDLRLYRYFGARSSDQYVRERLGFSTRKARALVKLDRRCAGGGRFAEAYRGGALSWVRAWTILPVIDAVNAAAWVVRAREVTVRRLAADVDGVLDERDRSGGCAPLDPPPLTGDPDPEPASTPARKSAARPADDSTAAMAARESSVASGVPIAEVQFGAHRVATDRCVDFAAWVCDGEIRFYAPASVVALVRRAIWAYSRADEPRWRAVERWLGAVVAEWERQPRHPDPIFARDGWRCTVPACSSRGPLHDHHLRFRSRGGGNERGNRTAVCVAHHLHGIHAGHVRGWGLAPHTVRWQLGVRAGDRPLMELVGDRYLAAATG